MSLRPGLILRGPQAKPLVLPAAKQSAKLAARLLLREQLQAQHKATQILDEAQHKAAQILDEAQHKVRSLRAELEQQAEQKARAELAAQWMLLTEQKARLDEAQLLRVLELSRVLAERLLGEAIRLDPHTLLALARQVLREFQRADRVTLLAHPEDVTVLAGQLEAAGFSGVQLQPDPTRARGSLGVQSSLGQLDASLSVQLDRLVQALARQCPPG